MAASLGSSESCLRNWTAQADIDTGDEPGLSSDERWELAELRGYYAWRDRPASARKQAYQQLVEVICVPVSHGQQVLAALNLYSRAAARSFTAVERDRARGLPDRAAGGVARPEVGPARRADRGSAGGAGGAPRMRVRSLSAVVGASDHDDPPPPDHQHQGQ